MEVDASGLGLGVVLMQNHHPIAFIGRSLNTQQQSLSTYEKELLAVVFVVQKWRHYLLPKKFIIRTDHRSLKYILDQRLSTTFQQKWLVKLMEFDLSIEYREGRENVVVDALSRLDSPEIMALQVHQPDSSMPSRIEQSWQKDPILQQLISDLKSNPSSHKHYTWVRNEPRRKGRLVIGSDSQLRQNILSWIHASTCGGHLGRDATLQKMKNVVYWRGIFKVVKFFVHQCVTFQRSKYNTVASPGLLQPLPIPEHVQQHITMDFIEGLPSSFGKQVIFIVVDRLSKASHFMALSHPYTAADKAQCFLDHVFKLHGFPDTITSDRDPVFVSHFWKEFMSLQGIQVQLSTAYHP